MCGIIGVLDQDRCGSGVPWDKSRLAEFESYLDTMAHRGPDDSGVWSDAGIMLGHRRLSILDLSPSGHQPMVSSAGNALVFNGEIYNYVELREALGGNVGVSSTGDTAVLLEALERWGFEATLSRLRGMFAFAFWNQREQKLWLACDHVGKKPLYIGRHGSQIVFGSTIASIRGWLRQRGWSERLDPVGINHALASGWVPAPRTGLLGIEKLPPAHAQIVDARTGNSQRFRYWSVPFTESGRRLDSSAKEELEDLFRSAIHRRLRSDVPVATLLSGGVDSSLVTAATAAQKDNLVAYTVQTHAGNDAEFDNAAAIAASLNIEQRVLELDLDDFSDLDALVSHFGEPFCDSSALPAAAIFRQASEDYRVLLTGDGGDEAQGGYRSAALFALRYCLWPADRDTRRTPTRARLWCQENLDQPRQRLANAMNGRIFRALRLIAPAKYALLAASHGLEQSAMLLRPEVRERLGRDEWSEWLWRFTTELSATNVIDQRLGFEFLSYLPDDLNVKVDVTSMASSLEARSPLLDIDFLEASWRIRAIDRVRPWERKRIVRHLLSSYLPKERIFRGKKGFGAPVEKMLRRPAGEARINSVLQDQHTVLSEILDWSAIGKLLDDCRRRGAFPAKLLWRLVVLDAWAKWLDG